MPKSPAPPAVAEDALARTRRAWRALPKIAVQPLSTFLVKAARKRISPADKKKIIDQAALMITHLYPHLPFKIENFHFFTPVQWIDKNIRPVLNTISDLGFHGHMIAAFSLVRDAHTLYGLPAPYRGSVAFLPFQIRFYMDDRDTPRFVITRVMNGFDHPHFRTGAELTSWNGFPMTNHVLALAGRLPGGNPAAALTRGTLSATLCPLTFCQPPHVEGDAIDTFQYVPAGSPPGSPQGSTPTRAIRIPWGLATGIDADNPFPNSAFSLSVAQVASSAWTDVLHPRPPAAASAGAAPATPLSSAAAALSKPSELPGVFEMTFTGASVAGSIDPANLVSSAGASGKECFGYIRIKTFSDGSPLGGADRIVSEFRRILRLMDIVAPDGLVLDIRRNPGGDVGAAERMLQMLTPREITPAKFHLANTPAVVAILQKLSDVRRHPGRFSEDEKDKLTEALAALDSWLDDAGNTPLPKGERVTSGQPLTTHAEANQIGQIYQGPVVLLIDALTYSAAEVFASGFQDHGIGVVIGADVNSGGGGANVWTHEDLVDKLGPTTDLKLEELPAGATLSLAVRRYSRVANFNGVWVEDVGIRADEPYVPRSAEAVVSGNPGLFRLACDALRRVVKCRVDLKEFKVLRDGRVKLKVATLNLDSLSFVLDGHPVLAKQSLVPGPGKQVKPDAITTHSFTLPAAPGSRSPDLLRILGFKRVRQEKRTQSLVAADRRVALKSPPQRLALPPLPALGSNPGGIPGSILPG